MPRKLSHTPLLVPALKIDGKLPKDRCFYPGKESSPCNGIINAHSVPVKWLHRIALNNHVYRRERNLLETIKQKNIFNPILEGIIEASTFRGFCSKHDDMLFAPIEKSPFFPSENHCFFALYRAVCASLYSKERQLNQLILTTSAGKEIGIDVRVAIDIPRVEKELTAFQLFKKDFDETLLCKDFKKLQYVALETDKVPSVLFTGVLPRWHPMPINENSSVTDSIALCNVLSGDKSFTIIGWIGHSKANEAYSRLIVKKVRDFGDLYFSDWLTEFVFSRLENVFFSPVWWNNLEKAPKNIFSFRTLEAASEPSIEPYLPIYQSCPWYVRKIFSSLAEI